MSDSNSYRLPRNVTPERYELTLNPDLDAATFAGEEKVRLQIHEATDRIVLNAADLAVLSADITNDDGDRVSGTVQLDPDTETLTVALAQEVQPGAWTLHATFTGELNDKLRGFYRSKYKDDSGNERTIATTQFESTDARRAFPCWDEPDLKAVFAVTLIVDGDLTALSNAGVREEVELGTGKRQVEFEDTIKMSTYLVAFIVGPLVITDPVDVDGVPLRVACVPGREAMTPFALESGAAALRFFSKYFEIPYPGGKLDMIAIPDFAAGAMENLGCVTFRETALLVDPARASKNEVERVAEVVGHEIAHMWFGDLVTMKWWNGLWLNEAFATFMEHLFVDDFRPTWQRWVTVGLYKSAAMSTDSLGSTRPIEYTVTSPHDAAGMFDILTYHKGAAVLRMLEQHIGPEVFRRGIAAYLKANAYGNAETTDLWDALDNVSDQPVRSLMDSWIFQGGLPIVHAEASGSELKLSQSKFRFLNDETDNTQWQVPVGLRAAGQDGSIHEQRVLLSDKQQTVTLPFTPAWVVGNVHGQGFFPVSYAPDLLQALTANVGMLDALERFSLVTDAWNACLAGRTDLAGVLSTMQLMRADTDPNVWGALVAPLRTLDHLIEKSDRPKLERFARELAYPNFERLGWDRSADDTEQDASLRGSVIAVLGGLGADEEIRREAADRFQRYQSDHGALDANVVNPVKMVLAATNDASHFETLKDMFTDESSSPQEKQSSMTALASFTDPTLVTRVLDMVQDQEIRSQDAPLAIRTMLTRKQTGAMVWEWCEQHWDLMNERFPNNTIDRLVEGTSVQTNPDLIARIDTFLQAHPIPQAPKSVAQTRERLQVNLEFHRRHAAEVAALLG